MITAMPTAPQPGKLPRRIRALRRHPRRPPGFGLWLLVAIGSLPAAAAALYVGESLGRLLAAIFMTGIFSHYVRLAFQRGSLEQTTRSGACLLPVVVWIYVIVTEPSPSFGLLCAATIPLVFLGAWAGFLAAVLIEAARSAWRGPGYRYAGDVDAGGRSPLLQPGRRTTTFCRWRCRPRASCLAAGASGECWSW